MIEKHFEEIEKAISCFGNIRSHTLSKTIYDRKQGLVRGTIFFNDNSRLDFTEAKNVDLISKLKYRYHYMDKKNNLVFRYDNAPHHKEIRTFPHHKHVKDEVVESTEKTLFEVLSEVDKYIRQKSSGKKRGG